MSEAIRCDRCKDYYTPGEAGGETIKFRNPRIYDDGCFELGNYHPIRRKGLLMKDIADDDDVDLCPKCTWLFKKFMDGREFAMVNMKDGESFEQFMEGYPGCDVDDSQQEQGS